MLNSQDSIYVAGNTGPVGAVLVRRLQQRGHSTLRLRTRADFDSTDWGRVDRLFAAAKPEPTTDSCIRLRDSSRIQAFGWQASTSFRQGSQNTYRVSRQ